MWKIVHWGQCAKLLGTGSPHPHCYKVSAKGWQSTAQGLDLACQPLKVIQPAQSSPWEGKSQWHRDLMILCRRLCCSLPSAWQTSWEVLPPELSSAQKIGKLEIQQGHDDLIAKSLFPWTGKTADPSYKHFPPPPNVLVILNFYETRNQLKSVKRELDEINWMSLWRYPGHCSPAYCRTWTMGSSGV